MSRKRRGRNRHAQQGGQQQVSSNAGTKKYPMGYVPKHVGTMALWIATPFGVLMPGTRPPHTYDAKTDDRSIQVRTREKGYLDRFRELYCPELGVANHFPNHDYPWKAYVTKEALAIAVARMVLDTDSEVFKPLTSGPKGLKDKKVEGNLHATYSSWWSTHLRNGDGTSSYDKHYTPSTFTVAGPQRCVAFGHWFTPAKDKCVDCNEPKPEGWSWGDPKVFPPKDWKPEPLSWGLGGAEHAGTTPLSSVQPWEYGQQQEPGDGTDYDDLHYGLIGSSYAEMADQDEAFAKALAEYDPNTGTCPECQGENGEHSGACSIEDAIRDMDRAALRDA